MKTSFALLALGFIVFAPACGIDVGNPTKPVAEISEADQNFALLASEQLEETLFAVEEAYEDEDEETALSLLASSLCEELDGGSVKVSLEREIASTLDIPRKSPKKRLDAKAKIQTTKVLSQPEGSLRCRIGGRRPAIAWADLNQLKIVSDVTRETEKTTQGLADGVVERRVSLKSVGRRESAWQKTKFEGSAFALTKTVKFSSTLEKKIDEAEATLSSKVESLDDLVIEQSFEQARLKSFKIVSGKVLSPHQEGQSMALSYSNLEFLGRSSCYPDSGTVEGQIVSTSEPGTVISRFKIIFEAGDAVLQFEDGRSIELEMNDCSLKKN